jgi:hypothetical protein
MMEKSAQAGEGGGPTPFHYSISTITYMYKVVVYAPAERADDTLTLPPILLYPNMHSVGEVKLEKRKKTADDATVNI